MGFRFIPTKNNARAGPTTCFSSKCRAVIGAVDDGVCICVCLLAALTRSKRVIKLTARPYIEANYHLLH